jgi:hypothetical protein
MLHHFVPQRSETITQSWLCGCKVVTTWSGSVMTTCSTSRTDLACRMNRDEPTIERVQEAPKSNNENLKKQAPPNAKAARAGE